jgi:hypothetical protein
MSSLLFSFEKLHVCCVLIAGERIIFLEIGTEVWYNDNETRCSKTKLPQEENCYKKLYGSVPAHLLIKSTSTITKMCI